MCYTYINYIIIIWSNGDLKGGNGVKVFSRLCKGEKGQGLVEYGLILALVSVVVVSSLGGVGDKVSDTFSSVINVEIQNKIDEGYIPVATADELNNIRNSTKGGFGEGTGWEGYYTSGLDKKYIIVSDIDMSPFVTFEPIGSYSDPFTGSFDGGGYDIKNLKINRQSRSYTGLFGNVKDSLLIDVGLSNVDVQGKSYVGGLVGSIDQSTILNSHVEGEVMGLDGRVGGLAGNSDNSSTIMNSSSIGKVSGLGNEIGGLVGLNYRSSSIESSYAKGHVSAEGDRVGGLVGLSSAKSSVNGSYSDIEVNGKGMKVGGLVGYSWESAIDSSYAIGKVIGSNRVGGLVGQNHSSSTISNSFATGDVIASGDIVGGLAGWNSGSSGINNSYTSGKVLGAGNQIGGLVGFNHTTSSVNDSGWDKDINQHIDKGIGTGAGDVTGYSTLEIKGIIRGLFR